MTLLQQRIYRTTSKYKLALAYGLQDVRTLNKRIRAKVDKLEPHRLTLLGVWTGNGHLLPDQVMILVEDILGTPESPEMVFTIAKNTA